MSGPVKAVALMSGGLDSTLAARLVMDQGIEVIGLSCKHPFHAAPPPGSEPYPERVARELGIELVRPDVTDVMLAMLKAPPHGYGKHMNPCIDCRIIYLTEGAGLMRERGAGFLVTGEVLGQRPMSQRRDAMAAIDRDSGLKGLILRPLSAGLMKPTVAEDKGWVDREKLLDVSGRGRGRQLALAESFGLKEFSSPGGGCLLTMEDFARKMKDLMDHSETLRREDVELLKHGRHFRLNDRARLVVGKDDAENTALLDMALEDDIRIVTGGPPGPVGIVRGDAAEEDVNIACRVLARYMKKAAGAVPFLVRRTGAESPVEAVAMGPDEVESYRI